MVLFYGSRRRDGENNNKNFAIRFTIRFAPLILDHLFTWHTNNMVLLETNILGKDMSREKDFTLDTPRHLFGR